MPHSIAPSIPPQSAHAADASGSQNRAAQWAHLGVLQRLEDAFGGKQTPSLERGAFQGEGVSGHYNASRADNYLYSLNAESCVIATLYDPRGKKGAVIHFDHNLPVQISEAVHEVLRGFDGYRAQPASISATMTGCDWDRIFGDPSVGRAVEYELRRAGVRSEWLDWTRCICLPRTFGVVLELQHGDVRVFEHSREMTQQLHQPLLEQANRSRVRSLLDDVFQPCIGRPMRTAAPSGHVLRSRGGGGGGYDALLTERAAQFMSRIRADVLKEAGGIVYRHRVDGALERATENEIDTQRVVIHTLRGG